MNIGGEQMNQRIAIVGAGPGGLVAGLALHQAGFDVKIYERAEKVTPLGGAIILNATGIVLLRRLGVDVSDIFAARLPEFRRYDGKVRVKFDLDPSLFERAGVSGWQSGMMRKELYRRLLDRVPDGMIVTGHEFERFDETKDGVTLHFKNGKSESAKLIIGADGIRSRVRQALWPKTPEPKKLGIAVWLGWCENHGAESDRIVVQHNRDYQMGFAPLLFEGKKCFEWWFVEKYDGQERPDDVMGYVKERLAGFAEPTHTILDATDPEHQLFRWVVEYIPCLPRWSKGRATILGDAAHPTSPYAAYGAGMAMEDGYFLGKYLAGKDLSSLEDVTSALMRYEILRRPYTNHTTKFARNLGRMYHSIPTPLKYLRDLFLDHSSIPAKKIKEGVTEEATKLLEAILDEDDHAPLPQGSEASLLSMEEGRTSVL